MSFSQSANFKSILQTAQDINDYDYNKMMNDFELLTRQNKIHDTEKRKWVKKNLQYKERIRAMKQKIKDDYKAKNEELMKKLADKSNLLVTSLNEKNKTKSEEKKKKIDALIQKEREAHENVGLFLEMQEEQRIKEAERTKEKSKETLYDCCLVAMFEERNFQKRKEFHDQYTERLTEKEKKYKENWEKYQKLLEEKDEERKRKEFQKYQAFYWHKKEVENTTKAYKMRNYSKIQAKKDKLEELEAKQEERKKEIFRKIRKMTKEKEKSERQKMKLIEEQKAIKTSKKQRINRKLLELDNQRMITRQEILDYENELLYRGLTMDEEDEKMKRLSQNRNITEQSVLEKDLSNYRKQMAMIKSESIFKKSPDERYGMFREKKRKEYELKKKLEEDKKLG